MSPEQQAIVIQVLQFGFATGAIDRFDCLRTFIRHYPARSDEAIDACLEFERGCGWSMEAAERLKGMTRSEFLDFVRHEKAAHCA